VLRLNPIVDRLLELAILLGIEPDQIRPNNLPYLKRWRLIDWDFFGVYLHRFDDSDPDPGTFHNHPWWALVFILEGSYVEGRLDREKRSVAWHRRTRFNLLRPNTWHRVELIPGERKPVWTLLVRGKRRWTLIPPDGPRIPDWGFFRPDWLTRTTRTGTQG
jgi:hypothetical protein